MIQTRLQIRKIVCAEQIGIGVGILDEITRYISSPGPCAGFSKLARVMSVCIRNREAEASVTLSDDELMQQIAKGDPLAYQVLVKRYVNQMLTFTWLYCPGSSISSIMGQFFLATLV